MKGDLNWDGKHTIQCEEDVWQNCVPETCIILLTNETPINSIKKFQVILLNFTGTELYDI